MDMVGQTARSYVDAMCGERTGAEAYADVATTLAGCLHDLPLGVVRFGTDGTIELITPLAARLLRAVAPGGDVSNAFAALAPAVPDLAGLIEAFAAPCGVVVNDVRHGLAVDGRAAVLSITVHRVAGGAHLAVLAEVTEAAERERRLRLDLQRAEAGLAHKSRLFELALAHMSQGIIMVDPEGVVQVMNQRMVDMLGLPPEMVVGEVRIEDLIRWHWRQGEYGPEGEALPPEVRALARAGKVGLELRRLERIRPDGTVLEVITMPMPGGGFVRTFTDITASKAAEARMAAARDKADQATRAKSEFLATMSHEIRSPMSGLIGVLDALRETGLDPARARMAEMANNSAKALLDVLNDVLDFSKIEAGAMAILPEAVNLRDLLDRMVGPLVLQARRRGVDLTLQVAAGVPGYAMTDPLRLRQILNNLLSNALKFTVAGEIAIVVDRAGDAAAPMLRFAVRDSGIGMSEEVVSRLFEPFMQADGSTTRDFGGTGLGLCICRRLAGLLDGTLGVASRPGLGSVFTLLVPAIAAAAPTTVAEDTDEPHAPGGLFDGRRALVVDDDSTIRWLSQRQLERLGWSVDVAEDGETALAMLRASGSGLGGYELLLTDCHMPRMDGVALTLAVRASPERATREILVVGVTADVTEAQHARCREAGMNEVATKPLNRRLLSGLLSRLVSPRLPPRGQDGASAPPAVSVPAVPEMAAFETAVFDDATYRDLFADDAADGAAWLGDYLLASGRYDESLLRLAGGGAAGMERDAIAAIAHRYAGSALSVGAMQLGEAARALERAAPCEDPAELLTRIHALHATFAAAEQAISTYIVATR